MWVRIKKWLCRIFGWFCEEKPDAPGKLKITIEEIER